MVIPEGYKNTEIGIIPEDWDVVTFENTFSVLRNNTLSRAELNYYNGDIQNIHYGDVLIKYPFILDCSKEKIPYINNDRTPTTSISFLQDGDIIITDTAEDEMVGKATEIVGVNGKNVVSGLHTIPCRAKNVNTFALKWLGYYINSRIFHDQIIPYITGIKVSSISKNSLFKTTVAYPEKSEQERIVTALSDIDILIDNLEKLISKKKNIKQGAMQELLTGKRRLPGFDGEWINNTLNSFGSFVRGNAFPLPFQGIKSEKYPFYKVSDFNNLGNKRFLIKANNYISEETARELNCNIIPAGSIVFATIGAAIFLERKKLTTVDCCIDNNTMSFQPHSKSSTKFLWYVFQQIRFSSFVEATALPSLSGKTVGSIIYRFPPTLGEQIAIAEVLSDMDNEIEELEKKLTKYCCLKQGMMSELLSGHIRLTEKEGA